jgi:two-component sensor histidine kinase
VVQWLLSSQSQGEQSFLHVAELLHRVRNEYARAISFAFKVAGDSSSQETKSALNEVIKHLYGTAETHRVLRPPHEEGSVDFTDKITQLCRAMTSSSEAGHYRINLLLAVDEPVLLDAVRCWRASLVVSELINNACRHAFASQAGRISVTVSATSERILCEVSDDGSPASSFYPGLGTHLVDALAAELGGSVKRRFADCGTTVTLSLPKCTANLSSQRVGAEDKNRRKRRTITHRRQRNTTTSSSVSS